MCLMSRMGFGAKEGREKRRRGREVNRGLGLDLTWPHIRMQFGGIDGRISHDTNVMMGCCQKLDLHMFLIHYNQQTIILSLIIVTELYKLPSSYKSHHQDVFGVQLLRLIPCSPFEFKASYHSCLMPCPLHISAHELVFLVKVQHQSGQMEVRGRYGVQRDALVENS